MHMSLTSSVLTRLTEENIALQQEVELLQRDDRFVWVIPHFEQKRAPLYSRKFMCKAHYWYLGVDFEGSDDFAGVYLFAEGHTKRVNFKLILYNADSSKDKVHVVNDWAVDYKGKGWGPLKFVNRSLSVQTGFLVNGCIRIGVEIEAQPFE